MLEQDTVSYSNPIIKNSIVKEKGDAKMLRRHRRSISLLLFLAVLCTFLPNLGMVEAEAVVIPGEERLYITGQKHWTDSNNVAGLRPQSVTVYLYADGVQVDSLSITAADDWRYSFDISDRSPLNAQGRTVVYTVGEGNIPYYASSVTQPTMSYTGPSVSDWAKHEPNNSLTIANNVGSQTIVGAKLTAAQPFVIWTLDPLTSAEQDIVKNSVLLIPGVGNPSSFEFLSGEGVYQNGLTVTSDTITFDATKNWALVFKGTYNKASASTTASSITNTFVPPTVDVQVTKSWQDNNNQDGIRPDSVTVKLLKGGSDTGKTLVLNAGNNWTGSFTSLDKYHSGEEIQYTVVEENVGAYASDISGSAAVGFIITNAHTPETIEISGRKTWEDADNQDGKRPEAITINLLNRALTVRSQEVTSANGWTWNFTNLPKYENGVEIEYRISENPIKDYTAGYNGYNVTNTYTPGKTSVQVIKSWDDANNQDGVRPESVTVKLLADGADTGKTLELNANNGWMGSFTNLDEKQGGREITYAVDEVSVAGYTSNIAGTPAGFTITNAHTPATIDVNGTKTWVDANNQDGKRPAVITISLMDGDSVLNTKTVSPDEGGNWAWSFINLPQYRNGVEIEYKISEGPVAGYTTNIDGYNATNTYTPELGTLMINKMITGSGYSRDVLFGIEIAPYNIAARSLGEEGNTRTVYVSVEKPTQVVLKTGTYLVREVGLSNSYSLVGINPEDGIVEIHENETATVTITNSYQPPVNPPVTPPVVEYDTVSGSKTWNDANNQDGMRPASITINLLKNGQQIRSKTVTAEAGWSWTFSALDRYENGTKVNYTITEDPVAGYTATYSGYNVINNHTPGKLSIPVTKIWQDENDLDGLRPDEVTVILLANEVDTGKTLILGAANNWVNAFTDLDAYINGQKVEYTIQEMKVADYTPLITGDTASGFIITNSYTPEIEEIPDEEIPGGPPVLPNTSGASPALFYGLGLSLIALGVKVRKR